MIFGLFRKRPARPLAAETVHDAAVAAARRPELYGELGVPDTLPGRFELVVLHVALALRRLRREDGAEDLIREVLEEMFRSLDVGLREIGIGDASLPKNMKRMARSFYDGAGRYDRALDSGDGASLAAELGRIVYAGEPPPAAAERLAAYVRAAERALSSQPFASLVANGPIFPTLERPA